MSSLIIGFQMRTRTIKEASRHAAHSVGFLLCFSTLAGCLAISPQAAAKLAGFDPLDANPAEIRIAIQAPRVLSVRPGDIVMTIARNAGNGKPSSEEKFYPEVEGDAVAAPGIPQISLSNTRLIIAKFSPSDQVRILKAQMAAKSAKADGTGGSLSVGSTGCRNDNVMEPVVAISIYMQTKAEDKFIPLTSNLDLQKALAKQGGVNSMPLCDVAAIPAK
jgi:hypothetical protein